MRRLFLATLLVLLAIPASAATITISMTTAAGTVSTTLTTDDASAQNILSVYTTVLDSGTPPNPACAPGCTYQQVWDNLAAQLAAIPTAFAQQFLLNAAPPPVVAVLTAPH